MLRRLGSGWSISSSEAGESRIGVESTLDQGPNVCFDFVFRSFDVHPTDRSRRNSSRRSGRSRMLPMQRLGSMGGR